MPTVESRDQTRLSRLTKDKVAQTAAIVLLGSSLASCGLNTGHKLSSEEKRVIEALESALPSLNAAVKEDGFQIKPSGMHIFNGDLNDATPPNALLDLNIGSCVLQYVDAQVTWGPEQSVTDVSGYSYQPGNNIEITFDNTQDLHTLLGDNPCRTLIAGH